MRHTAIAVLILTLALPAVAGQNPDVGIYLYSTSTGVGGTNHKPSPLPGGSTSVYVCFDHFGPGGGFRGARWSYLDVPGPEYFFTQNLYDGVGGVTWGDPRDPGGITMTTPTVYPDANGVVVLARARYETPEELVRGGKITLIPGGVVMDASGSSDWWCVHTTWNDGLSGNWYWDDGAADEGDCGGVTPVESSSWGSIKVLYK